jgi:rfaE bifunctional protein kinase chain/domain
MEQYFSKFDQQKIMVFGDLIADIYEYGLIKRMSREAPIPIVEFQYDQVIPGGAGNVVFNVASLSGRAVPVSVLGNDDPGEKLLARFAEQHIDVEKVLQSPDHFTTTKRRILAQCEHTVRQQVLRLDRLPQQALSDGLLSELWDIYRKCLDEVSAVVISDYHLPVFPERFFLDVAQLASERRKFVIVDSRHRIMKYRNVSLLTPSRSEAEEAVGFEFKEISDLTTAGKILLEATNAEAVLITLGDQGMALFEPEQEPELIPVHNKQEVFDVSGAGDTVVASVTLGVLSGMSLLKAARFSNMVAGLVVRKIGTATVTLNEIRKYLEEPVAR